MAQESISEKTDRVVNNRPIFAPKVSKEAQWMGPQQNLYRNHWFGEGYFSLMKYFGLIDVNQTVYSTNQTLIYDENCYFSRSF